MISGESVVLLPAVVALGLSAGALLAEGAVLVPFWRSTAPEAFLAWYREHGGLLVRFFGPLEVVAALLACVAAAVLRTPLAIVAAVLALAVLAAFPLYFQRTNASFADASIDVGRVPEELRRWADWHQGRVVIATTAFVAALLEAL